MKPKIAALAVAALLLVGGGAFALTRFMAPAEDEAISIVPKDAVAYGNMFIEPSNSQKGALDDLAGKFGFDGADEAIEKLVELFDRQLAESGLTYDEDIEPWLGNQVGFFATAPRDGGEVGAAVMIESTDDEAALAAVEKASEDSGPATEKEHDGVTYWMSDDDSAYGFVGGFLVGGTEDGVKAAIDTAAGEESLEDSEKFTDTIDPLREDWLGLFYVDTPGVFEAIEDASGAGGNEAMTLSALGLEGQTPTAAVLYVTSQSIAFESVGSFPTEGPFASLGATFAGSGPLEELPGEAWIAFGIPDIGGIFTGLLEGFAGIPGVDSGAIDGMIEEQFGIDIQEDLLSWMGDGGFFVEGTNFQELGGGIVIESSDPDTTVATVEKIRRLLTAQGVPVQPAERSGLEGFSVQLPGVPAPIYVLGGDRLVVSYGEGSTDEAIEATGTLGESEPFRAAIEDLGDGYEPSFYVSVDTAQELVETFIGFAGEASGVYEQEIKRWLEPFSHVIAGASVDGDTVVQKLVVGVR